LAESTCTFSAFLYLNVGRFVLFMPKLPPASINMGVRSKPKVPFTSSAIPVLLTHIDAISCNLVNHRLGFFPLTPMAASHPEMFQKFTTYESEIRSWSGIISFLNGKCSNGDRLMGKISLHRIPMRLWCYLPFFNADSAYPLGNSSAASFIITRPS
jgi:hypothetical protein